MNQNILTGKTEEHLVVDEYSKLLVHQQMLPALEALREEAKLKGFSLEIASAFRGFEAQLAIWNAKARGLRPLFDDQGVALDFQSLSPIDIVYAILRWSALPGASRHHWGTDFDVYDKSRMPADYKVQLLPSEYEAGGVFGDFNIWMNKNLNQFQFYRPYEKDTGGIAPEMWHLSYFPLSNDYQRALSYELIQSTIENADIELKDIILAELPLIYPRFINI